MKKYVKLSLLTFIVGLLGSSVTMHAHAQRVVVTPRTVVVTKHSPRVVKRTYYHAPRYGYVVTKAPGRTTVVRYGGTVYHYHRGIYYVQRPGGFVVVHPSIGLRIRVLPTGYSRIVVAGTPYFYFYGVFYRSVANTEEYIVVKPPVGIIVDAIPEGYKIEHINNSKYLVLNDVCYEEIKTDLYKDGIGYKVVELN
ncbi:DUF6515 family protein [Maribellus maritimus]|uniref:DUF6515 family protein n=1 Tax=Maribellus maritimus TaxID=2870838 RepID=UPI001EEC76A9|nr:DUF6515 family protein [Maribellus maritimus]MCG6191183.1 DUF6515 family protein [Maribellus maritimus]